MLVVLTGIPMLVLMPAPVMTKTLWDPAIISATSWSDLSSWKVTSDRGILKLVQLSRSWKLESFNVSRASAGHLFGQKFKVVTAVESEQASAGVLARQVRVHARLQCRRLGESLAAWQGRCIVIWKGRTSSCCCL